MSGGGVVTLKTGRREVPGSNPGRASLPSRSEISVVFSEIRVNTGWDPLERPPPIGPGPTSGQLALKPTINQQPINLACLSGWKFVIDFKLTFR